MAERHPTVRQAHVAVVFAIAALSTATVHGGEPARGYALVGQVQPRHAREIEASSWSVGAETMDRDYTIYAAWERFVGAFVDRYGEHVDEWEVWNEPGRWERMTPR